MKENVFVCGGGHQGFAMASYLALNGVDVTLWNRTRDHIRKVIETGSIVCNGVVTGEAHITKASECMEEVFRNTVLVTVPSSAYDDVAKRLAPFVSSDTVIILNPGRTFGAIDFSDKLKKYGAKGRPHIAETQTILYTCRKSGENSATIFAMKKEVDIAVLKESNCNLVLNRLPKCIQGYFTYEKSVIKTSLENVGMILHCAPVLMNIGWIENEEVDFKYYYNGISKAISKYIEKMDDERRNVARKLGFEIESTAEWMRRSYGVKGDSLYECIKNNMAYKEIDAPPTINSRYIIEDVPNGLVPIEYLGKELKVDTFNITTIINLANAVFDVDFRKRGRQIGLVRIKEEI